MGTEFSRREMMVLTGACLGAAAAAARSSASAASEPEAARGSEPFGYCLNMATIMGQKLSVVDQIEVAAKAGWQGVEPWIRDIRRYVDEGG